MLTSIILFSLSLIFSLIVKFVDVQSVGPDGSSVGLATLNSAVHSFLGVHPLAGTLTDIVAVLAFATVAGFAVYGLVSVVKQKGLKKLDRSFFALFGFYLLVAVVYIIFEKLALNFRPILIDSELEPSFPSSHTLFAVCLFSSADLMFSHLSTNKKLKNLVSAASVILIAFMAFARLVSGVHWLTDILGGLLIGFTLVSVFRLALARVCPSKKDPVEALRSE